LITTYAGASAGWLPDCGFGPVAFRWGCARAHTPPRPTQAIGAATRFDELHTSRVLASRIRLCGKLGCRCAEPPSLARRLV